MPSNHTTPQPRYGIWIAIFLLVGAGGIYYARQLDQRNDRETAGLRAIRSSINSCSLAAPPGDWPRVSLGPISLCLPPQSEVQPVKDSKDRITLGRSDLSIIISNARTMVGKDHLVRYRARHISFPRDWDEVDARAVIHAIPSDQASSLRQASSNEMSTLKGVLSPSDLQGVEFFRNENGVKGLVISLAKITEVQYWSKDEQTLGVLQIWPVTPENQALTSQIVSSLRVESPSTASQPAEPLLDQCRRLLLTSKPA